MKREKNILAKQAFEQQRRKEQARIKANKEELDKNLKNFNQPENNFIQKIIDFKLFFSFSICGYLYYFRRNSVFIILHLIVMN